MVAVLWLFSGLVSALLMATPDRAGAAIRIGVPSVASAEQSRLATQGNDDWWPASVLNEAPSSGIWRLLREEHVMVLGTLCPLIIPFLALSSISGIHPVRETVRSRIAIVAVMQSADSSGTRHSDVQLFRSGWEVASIQ
jgi:hypothetical protein